MGAVSGGTGRQASGLEGPTLLASPRGKVPVQGGLWPAAAAAAACIAAIQRSAWMRTAIATSRAAAPWWGSGRHGSVGAAVEAAWTARLCSTRRRSCSSSSGSAEHAPPPPPPLANKPPPPPSSAVASSTQQQQRAQPPLPLPPPHSPYEVLLEGKRFVCTECGKCCQGSGEVWANDKECAAMARHLGLQQSDFLARYTKAYSKRPGWRMLKLQPATGDCVFLAGGTKCSIYPVRPMQCRCALPPGPACRGYRVHPASLAGVCCAWQPLPHVVRGPRSTCRAAHTPGGPS